MQVPRLPAETIDELLIWKDNSSVCYRESWRTELSSNSPQAYRAQPLTFLLRMYSGVRPSVTLHYLKNASQNAWRIASTGARTRLRSVHNSLLLRLKITRCSTGGLRTIMNNSKAAELGLSSGACTAVDLKDSIGRSHYNKICRPSREKTKCTCLTMLPLCNIGPCLT